MKMVLIINGIEKYFDDGVTIENIIDILQIQEKVMACAVNVEIVKKDDWKSFQPKNNDKIEFLQFVGGG
jgi:sulfur carrier protein